MESHILALLGKEHPARILLLLRSHGSLRFSQIREATGLNPSQVDRSLKLLRQDLWIIPETHAENRGPVNVHYRISGRGEALLKALDSFRSTLSHERAALGRESVDEIEALYA